MNKRKLSAIVLTLILLIGNLAACDDEDNSTERGIAGHVPATLADLFLTDIWAMMQQASPVEEGTAVLNGFTLNVPPDGPIYYVSFEYQGTSDGTNYRYYANTQNDHGIRWNRVEVNGVAPSGSLQPRDFFTDLDAYGLQNLNIGEDGAMLYMWPESYGGSYSSDYYDLYLLQQGTLVPLKEIEFREKTAHTPIKFVYRPVVSEVNEEGEQIAKLTPPSTIPVPEEERTSEYWFLERDLYQVESIEYLSEAESDAEQPLGGLPAIPDISRVSFFVSYPDADIEEVQARIERGELLYRRDDPVATTLAFFEESKDILDILNIGEVESADLVFENPDDQVAIVLVITDESRYMVSLQKLGGDGEQGIWCVIGIGVEEPATVSPGADGSCCD